MDKELIKKLKLEEAIKRFGMINEYIYETFDEADDPNAQGGDPNMGGTPEDMQGGDPNAMGMDPNMGGDPNAMGDPNAQANPDMQGGDPNMMGDPNAMGGAPADMGMDPNMGGTPVDMNGEGMPEADPNAMEGNDPNAMEGGMETEPMQDGDEVIDVDDLTTAQEETDYKIDGVNDKLTSIMQVIDKFDSALAASNEKIADLQKELELRNPTPTERLNLRSQAGYPFNVQPKDFWEKKSIESPQYEIDFGNDDNTSSSDREEYILRKGDVKGGNDRAIADTLGVHKLSDYLNY